jgi:peptidoglycan/xylan/chitin deacetylase (PgdA/CDA1 family)
MSLLPSLRRLSWSIDRLLRTEYPAFILGVPPRRPRPLAFVSHDVDPGAFALDLEFLAENGYRTLTTAEYVRAGATGEAGRAVLLTFDDARRNFWEVAFPLLQRFEARATLFVPTCWPAGAGGEPEAPERELFMTWAELRACARSGLVDVEPHGHRHALVYAGTGLAGFVSPEILARYDVFEWPMRRESGEDVLGRPPLGTPIYQSTPLLSARFRLLEDPAPVRACRALVADEGGAAFFARRDPESRLRAAHARAAGRRSRWTALDDAAFRALVASEFELARHRFERELGRRPRYWGYPWMLGSGLSLELAAGAGIEAVFGVGIDFRRAERLRRPLPAFARLKGDWLRFLPGRRRRDLLQVLPGKLTHLIHPGHLSH